MPLTDVDDITSIDSDLSLFGTEASVDPLPAVVAMLHPVVLGPTGIRVLSRHLPGRANITLKAGDTLPMLMFQLVQSGGKPVDLTLAASVRLILRDRYRPVSWIDAIITPDEPRAGKLSYDLQSIDTAAIGRGNLVVKALFDDGKVLTFPTVQNLTVQILP